MYRLGSVSPGCGHDADGGCRHQGGAQVLAAPLHQVRLLQPLDVTQRLQRQLGRGGVSPDGRLEDVPALLLGALILLLGDTELPLGLGNAGESYAASTTSCILATAIVCCSVIMYLCK